MDRRNLLVGIAAVGAAVSAQAQTPPPPVERAAAAAGQAALPIVLDGAGASGPGWDVICREAARAQYMVIGEEHGLAETPRLATALYRHLRPTGLREVILETSAGAAKDLEAAASRGVEGLTSLVRRDEPGPPFYGWRPEAEFLTAVRGMSSGPRLFLGIDYEIWWSDRRLIPLLQQEAPPGARAALAALKAASDEGWRRFSATRDLLQLYLINGDPELVGAVGRAWPRPRPETRLALATLQETVEINRLFAARQGYASNQRRAAFLRANLARHLVRKPDAKLLVKVGTEHATRGVNSVGGFDVGSLLPEAAALRGERSFHLLVVGGADGRHAVMDATTFKSRSEPVSDLADMGLDALRLPQDGIVAVDLRPLRTFAAGDRLPPQLVRHIMGFDVLVVVNRSTASVSL
jgi:hypothetical protein